MTNVLSGEAGSSPRMRGTPAPSKVARRMIGIIPAYAGNTPRHHPSSPDSGDHPRVCGEHKSLRTWAAPLPGSSPRMRGTLTALGEVVVHAGIIPAYAGNTSPYDVYFTPSRDHPRVCGEHLIEETSESMDRGSSPRMRGTLWLERVRSEDIGIIPAYAGNTEPLLLPKLRTLGSSPRMRGTHYRSVHREHGHGIIPAYAGNTSPTAAIHPTRRDHPRVCGEHRVVITVLIKHSGSSPRMRGTREASGPSMRFRGIIPAYAGNTGGGYISCMA